MPARTRCEARALEYKRDKDDDSMDMLMYHLLPPQGCQGKDCSGHEVFWLLCPLSCPGHSRQTSATSQEKLKIDLGENKRLGAEGRGVGEERKALPWPDRGNPV